MQNFLPSNATVVGAGASLLGAALDWATGRQPAQAPPTPSATGPADPRPLLEIDARLAELLAIDVTEPRTKRDAASDTAAFKPDSQTAKDAARLLAPPLAKAREWLASAKIVAELAEQGMAPSLVEKFLKRNAERFLQGYPARTWNGEVESLVKMPQIPTAHDLFSYALLDAQVAYSLRNLPIPEDAGPSPTVTTTVPTTTTTATTTTTTTTTTTKAPAPTASTPLMVNGYYVESTRGPIRNHAQAMEALRQFRINLRSHLPQFGGPTMQGFWGLREGKVVLGSLNVALASVPCAIVHVASDNSRTVTYPQGSGSSGRLQRIMVNGEEVMFARGANANRALYSTNGLDWYDTHVYTDDAVEAQKVALWSGIIESSKASGEKYRKAARWIPW